MPDASARGRGREDHRHRPDPPVGDLLVGDVGAAPGVHLASDRRGSGTVVGTHDRADGCDVGPRCDARIERLLPSLHREPRPGRDQGHLYVPRARPRGADRLLRIHPRLTTRPPATERLRRAAGPSRARRVSTPDRPRSRLVHSPMPTRSLARWHGDLTVMIAPRMRPRRVRTARRAAVVDVSRLRGDTGTATSERPGRDRPGRSAVRWLNGAGCERRSPPGARRR